MVFPGNGNSRGNKGLKIEDYILTKEYSITINPQLQPKTLKHLGFWMRETHDWFAEYNDTMNIKLWMESSGTGRIHFHGIIKVLDLPKFVFFLKELNRISHFEIDTIGECNCNSKKKDKPKCTGMHIWNEYITKQYPIWNNYFSKFPYYYPMVINKQTNIIRLNEKKKLDQPIGLYKYGYKESHIDPDLEYESEDSQGEEILDSKRAERIEESKIGRATL